MRRVKICLLLCFWCVRPIVYCQNTIGLPAIFNYNKQSFTAGLQNWDIEQDQNGIVYFANNEGLLSFDGTYWKLYALPNKTIVRAITITPNGNIYVGGQDELGYFSPADNGQLSYTSLTGLLSQQDKNFGDVWDIAFQNNKTYFRTSKKIFELSGNAFGVFRAPFEWSYMEVCNNRLYAHDYETGMMYLDNSAFKPLGGPNIIPANDPVTGILPLAKDRLVVTTLKNGLFYLTPAGLSKLNAPGEQLFRNSRIYSATIIGDKKIALGTSNNGVLIIDEDGNVLQAFTTNEGLQNNNVLSIFSDSRQNLWLGLDNGITMVAYNTAIKQVTPGLQSGSGYTALVHDKSLYLGTTSGLYTIPIESVADLSNIKGRFSLVKNSQGQTWGLAEINNHLLMGHHDGAFVVAGNTASVVSAQPGFWSFVPLSSTFPSKKIIAGHYNGLSFFDYENGKFSLSGNIPGFNESSRFVVLDQQQNIWVSHPYHGVFKITTNAGRYMIANYSEQQGLPSELNNHIYKLKNEVVAATSNGIYVYDAATDRFKPSPYYQKIFGSQSIRYLTEDPNGNIWFTHEKMPAVADLEQKTTKLIYLPELNNKLVSGFEYIYPIDGENILIGGENGFFHLNYKRYKQLTLKPKVQIRLVQGTNETDSLYFGGYVKTGGGQKKLPRIADGLKTLRFEYASPMYGYQANLEYSYRLKGLDEHWSEWTRRTEKEYTNLPPGSFTFEVRVRNNLGSESPAAAFAFKVLPPWYKTTIALIIWGILFLAGNIIFFSWLRKQFIRQQQKHEEEQKRLLYIHELERNKTASELVKLQNEKLEAEINYKNSELASSAMHLVKKGELLTKLKAELAQIMKNHENPKLANDLKKMIRSVGEDDSMDQEWEHFAIHFDKVHSDFIMALKEKHPSITSNEIKLCAYLRMNLSTKEMARLMNISVRGVEISRYRLRKKLQLPTETSLFDYLIGIKPES